MVLEPTTPELSKSRSALISSQTLPDIQERFAATIWVSTPRPSQRYRLPYVACIAQRSSDQPRRWFQYYAPADHSTSLYVRFYGVVRPPSACPTLSTSPGRRAGRSLMDSMPFTGRGLHPAGRFSSSNDMPKTPRVPRRLSILARLWSFPRRSLRPFVHPRPRPR